MSLNKKELTSSTRFANTPPKKYYNYNNTGYMKEGDTWYKSVNGNYVPLTKGNIQQRYNVLNQYAKPVVANRNMGFNFANPGQQYGTLKASGFEDKIDKLLGSPMQKAWAISNNDVPQGEDPADNIRHPMAGYYTARSLGTVPGIPIANAMGVAHEMGTLFTDPREWKYKLPEAGEDMFNNFVGTLLSPLPERQAFNIVRTLSDNNLLPDGLVLPNGANAYLKQYGGLTRFNNGGPYTGSYYTYPGSKGVYRKVGNKWEVDWNRSGNFQPLAKGDVAKRSAQLNKGAKQLFDQDYYDQMRWKNEVGFQEKPAAGFPKKPQTFVPNTPAGNKGWMNQANKDPNSLYAIQKEREAATPGNLPRINSYGTSYQPITPRSQTLEQLQSVQDFNQGIDDYRSQQVFDQSFALKSPQAQQQRQPISPSSRYNPSAGIQSRYLIPDRGETLRQVAGDYVGAPDLQTAVDIQNQAGLSRQINKELEQDYGRQQQLRQANLKPHERNDAIQSADWFWTLPLGLRALPSALEGLGTIAAKEIPFLAGTGLEGLTLGTAADAYGLYEGIGSGVDAIAAQRRGDTDARNEALLNTALNLTIPGATGTIPKYFKPAFQAYTKAAEYPLLKGLGVKRPGNFNWQPNTGKFEKDAFNFFKNNEGFTNWLYAKSKAGNYLPKYAAQDVTAKLDSAADLFNQLPGRAYDAFNLDNITAVSKAGLLPYVASQTWEDPNLVNAGLLGYTGFMAGMPLGRAALRNRKNPLRNTAYTLDDLYQAAPWEPYKLDPRYYDPNGSSGWNVESFENIPAFAGKTTAQRKELSRAANRLANSKYYRNKFQKEFGFEPQNVEGLPRQLYQYGLIKEAEKLPQNAPWVVNRPGVPKKAVDYGFMDKIQMGEMDPVSRAAGTIYESGSNWMNMPMADQTAHSEFLNSAMQNAFTSHFDEPTVLHRLDNLDYKLGKIRRGDQELEGLTWQDLLEGDEFAMDRVWSTAGPFNAEDLMDPRIPESDPGWGASPLGNFGGHRIQITAPANTKMFFPYGQGRATYVSERELALPRGQRFRVTKPFEDVYRNDYGSIPFAEYYRMFGEAGDRPNIALEALPWDFEKRFGGRTNLRMFR
jgi:hypothetical protein